MKNNFNRIQELAGLIVENQSITPETDNNNSSLKEMKGKMKLSELKKNIKESILSEKDLQKDKKKPEKEPEPEMDMNEPIDGMEMGSEMSNSTGGFKEVQDSLTKAQEAAKAMGDEKLVNQIGNTLVYLVRSNMTTTDSINENLGEYEAEIMDPIYQILDSGISNEEAIDFLYGLQDKIGELIKGHLDTPGNSIDDELERG